jgi:hypothetical protein
VTQKEEGIFISQSGYAKDILEGSRWKAAIRYQLQLRMEWN